VGVFVGAAEQDVDRLSLFDVHRVFAGFAAADMAVNVAVVRGRRDYGGGFGRSLAGGNGEVVWRRFAAFGRRLQHIDLDAVFATLLGGAFVFSAVERAVVQHFVAFGWHQQVVGAGVRCGEFDGKALPRLEIERVVGGLFAADAAFDLLDVVGVRLCGSSWFFGGCFFARGFFLGFAGFARAFADGGFAVADGRALCGCGLREGKGREAGESDEGFVHETDSVKLPRKQRKVYSEEEAEAIIEDMRDFISKLFEKMEINVNMDTEFNHRDNEISVFFSSDDDIGLIIGKRGQTLDAIQYIVSLVVNKNTESYIRIKMDTENYRERRKENLEVLAKNVASKVKKFKKPISLEPMNPYERRIIHSVLQSDNFVSTRSDGDEPFRYITVIPRYNKRNNYKRHNNNFNK